MSPLPPTCFGTPATALDGTGRDGTDGTRGEGRPAPRARIGRAVLAPQAASGGPGQLATGREGGR